MKQFCPKCCKWYDTDMRFCPKCDVGLYYEREYESITHKGKSFKVLSRQQINKIHDKGHLQIIGGVFLLIVAIGFFSNSKYGGKILVIFAASMAVAGIFIFLLGMSSMSKSNSFKSNPKIPHIQCPYCKSVHTTKIQTLDRMGSIILTGAASGKIGKQWHCNDCKSDF